MQIKTFLKFLIIVLTIVLCILIFLVWQERKPGTYTQTQEAPSANTNQNISNKLASIKSVVTQQKVKLIAKDSVISPVIYNNKLNYFDAKTGYVYQVSADGTRKEIIKQEKIPNIISALWSPDTTKVIITTKQGKYFYDYTTNQVLSVDFPNQIAWSPDSTKVAFVCKTGICISDPDSYNKTTIFYTELKELNLNWQECGIYFWQKPSLYSENILYLLDTKSRTIQKMLNMHYGLSVLPYKTQFAYSIKGRLFTNNAKLNIDGLAEKCVWKDQDILYCAGPLQWPNNAIIPDDYYKEKFSVKDRIWEINLAEKIKKEILRTPYNIDTLLIANNKLFFTEKQKHSLHLINLD